MSMVVYQLNLARGRVWPLESRKRRIRWFLGYLLLAAVVIAVMVQDVIRRDGVWRRQRDILTTQEQRLVAAHPGFTTMAEVEQALEGRLAIALRDLECIRAFNEHRFRPAALLAGLIEPLPGITDLGTVELDIPARTVRFDVVAQDDAKAGEAISPPQLASTWERFPVAGAKVSRIEAGNSERIRLNGLNVMCWRFSATLGD